MISDFLPVNKCYLTEIAMYFGWSYLLVHLAVDFWLFLPNPGLQRQSIPPSILMTQFSFSPQVFLHRVYER